MRTPLGLAFAKIVLMALIGVPIAALTDPTGRVFYLTGGRSAEWLWTAYWWTLYAVVVMLVGVWALGLNRRLSAYQDRAPAAMSRATHQRLWAIAFGGALLCTVFLFVQNGFRHPGLMALRLDKEQVRVLRIVIWESLNQNVYNVGVHLFAAFALAIAGFVLKSLRLFLLTLVLFVTLVTFSLAKSPIADTVVELAFVYMVLRRPPWKVVLGLAGALVLALAAAVWFTSWVTGAAAFALFLVSRIVWGQISDLPHYFNLFANHQIGFLALLPPYVQTMLGHQSPSAARLVVEFSNPAGVQAGVAGVANTFYVGEAYAFAGVPGILASPFLVLANAAFVIWLFGRLRKDVFTVFLYGFLLDRMTADLFAGISPFVFSSMHIVLGALLLVVLAYEATRPPVPAIGLATSG